MTVASPPFSALRTRFRGALLRPGEEGYDETRKIWNGAIDRRPSLIARPVGTDDVIQAVRYAREHELLVSVRGGGHAVAGHAVCDDGLMIDLSLLKGADVAPLARTVKAAGGMLWREVDGATQRHGLATTGGIISHTGIGGLTLGGGLGHLMRHHGLTVDNLLSADLVTADAELVHADAESEPDLFWALRGGGGNFGIVTKFEYRLHEVGPIVLGGPIFWPIDQAHQVLDFLREFAPNAPDPLGITFVTMSAPPMPFLPPDQYGQPVLGMVVVWSGDIAEGEAVLAPLRGTGKPLADVVRPVPYVAIQSMLDGGAPHGRHYYWKSHRTAGLPDDVIEAFLERTASMTSPFSQLSGWVMGGAVTRVDSESTAVPREAGYDIGVIAAWQPGDPEPDRHRTWVRDGWDKMLPHSTGVYVNFISDEGASGVDAAYGDRLARLTAVKDKYDPGNFFRMNANIAPSEAAR